MKCASHRGCLHRFCSRLSIGCGTLLPIRGSATLCEISHYWKMILFISPGHRKLKRFFGLCEWWARECSTPYRNLLLHILCRKLKFGVLHSRAALVLATPVAITIHVIWTYKNSRSEAGCWIAFTEISKKFFLVSCALLFR